MGAVKTHTFNGTTYDIHVGKCDGFTDVNDNYGLVIGRELNTRAGLETAIHEALHACNWHTREELVEVSAKDIARFLWRLGYRVG